MKRLNWLWMVGLAGCTQLAGLGDYTFDLDEETGGSAGGDAGTGGATGGTGGATGGTGGATGGTGGMTGGTGGATGGTGGAKGGEGGIGGAAGATGGEGGIGGAAGGCPTTCGALEEDGKDGYCVAKSVPMPHYSYSIDATEVTRCQYDAWLSTNPPTAGQPSFCNWNTTYQPDSECMELPNVCKDSNCGNHPVVCVDFCDAYAYCQAVGKRLCGRIGGGTNGFGELADALKSQWFAACSSGGNLEYPYGSSFKDKACNGSGAKLNTTSEVGSFPDCHSTESGYEGVFDMSGNVWEWEDSHMLKSGATDACRVRGGSYRAFSPDLRCRYEWERNRNSHYPDLGFRCCSFP
jgi:formylglycine-generating enzyme required for sulfatase activity